MRVEKAGEKTLLERENRRLRFQVQRGHGLRHPHPLARAAEGAAHAREGGGGARRRC